MGNSIKSHLENARKTGVCQLIDMDIKEWCPELQKLCDNLRTLDLSKNRLISIPPEVGTFTQLKNLTVVGNRLTSVADEIGALRKLEVLNVDHNMITCLPRTVHNLSNLKTVSLSENKFRDFPIAFCGLKHLDSINLSKNCIESLPDDIEDLQVIELNLNQNQLNRLPATMASCQRLKVLRVEENCLDLISFPKDLLMNSHISLLALEGNMFTMKEFSGLDGHDQYIARYTATKKKCV